MRKYLTICVLAFFVLGMTFHSNLAYAKTVKEIDAGVDAALIRLKQQFPNTTDLLGRSKGVLIFPEVIKAGFGIGGEYGEGALRIKGKTVDYYNTIGGSFGFQMGGQIKTIYLFFMEPLALEEFRAASGWTGGLDASVAFVTLGKDGSIDTTKINKPIMAFVMDQKGLMYSLTLGLGKFNKIYKPY